MKAEYSDAVNEALEVAPAAVRKAFFKQISFLVQNLQHPSLHAKKYDERCEKTSLTKHRNIGSITRM
jgi:hypothetical protein